MRSTPVKWLATCGLLLASAAANAQFSSTITLTNDYDFRGFSQSAKDPALQGSLDYAFANGFAIGAWASNIDFEPFDGDIELDLYGSYTGSINDNLGWTAGFVYYLYPGSDSTVFEGEELPALGEYPEIYVGLNAGPFAFKQWYSNDLYESDESAFYTEGNVTYPIGETNFSVLGHVGYSWGDYWDEAGGEIFDYSVGVGYAAGRFNFALKYTGTDASGDQKITDDVGNNEGRVVFSVATTLPWRD